MIICVFVWFLFFVLFGKGFYYFSVMSNGLVLDFPLGLQPVNNGVSFVFQLAMMSVVNVSGSTGDALIPQVILGVDLDAMLEAKAYVADSVASEGFRVAHSRDAHRWMV